MTSAFRTTAVVVLALLLTLPLRAIAPKLVKRKVVVTAYWPPNAQGGTAFFQTSSDLKTWVKFSEVPYPTNGAWLKATNFSSDPIGFYRAGSTSK